MNMSEVAGWARFECPARRRAKLTKMGRTDPLTSGPAWAPREVRDATIKLFPGAVYVSVTCDPEELMWGTDSTPTPRHGPGPTTHIPGCTANHDSGRIGRTVPSPCARRRSSPTFLAGEPPDNDGRSPTDS